MKKVYKILLLIFFIVIITLSIVLPLTIVKKKCSQDSDCKPNQTCIGGVCVDNVVPEEKCSQDSDCKSNQTCIEGVCVDNVVPEGKCSQDSDCKSYQTCIGGVCVDKIKNYKCSNNTCITVDGTGDYEKISDCEKYCNNNIRLHLYHGAFPNLKYSTEEYTKTHWKAIADFAKNKNFYCVYMNGDASKSFITSSFIAQLASYVDSKIILGVVISANPKYTIPDDFISEEQPGGSNNTPIKALGRCSDNIYPNGIGSYGSSGNNAEPMPVDEGCPNVIENFIWFYGEVNKQITILNNSRDYNNKIPYFTRFIQDGENNGTAVARYSNWINACFKYIIPTLPVPYYEDGIEYTSTTINKIIKVGQAFSGSTNAPDLVKSTECVGSTYIDKCKESVNIQNMLAYPELYWYSDGIAQVGCTGCDQNIQGDYRNVKTNDGCTDLCPNECKKYINENFHADSNPPVCNDDEEPGNPPKCCKKTGDKVEACSTFSKCMNTTFTNEDGNTISCAACCHCLGCIPCGYDKNGNKNPDISYLNKNPEDLASYMIKNAEDKGILDLWKSTNTIPMFSNEIAHNYRKDESGTGYAFNANNGIESIYGKNCLGRRTFNGVEGGNICGSFDGFGLWPWFKFYEFVYSFSNKTGIKDIGVYDAQFISSEWMGELS